MITAIDKRLNGLLLRDNLVPKEKLDEVMEIAKKEAGTFLDLLVDRSVVEEATVLGLLAREVKIPPVTFDKIQPEEKVLQEFTEERANYFTVLPISKIGNIITLAVVNPYDIVKFDSIRQVTNCEISLVLGLERRLRDAIKHFYNPEDHQIEQMLDDVTGGEIELTESDLESDKLDLEHLTEEASESPVIKIVNVILFRALKEGASDIHIEPYEKKVRVRFRQDGILREMFFPPRQLHNAIITRLKIMAGLDISERRVPQDGKFQIKHEGRRIDFRVGIIPTIHGERAMMRLLDSSTLTLSIKDIGFEPSAYESFQRAINASYGMVLVTGPTGSGKTTTLYCAIKEIYSPGDNLITVEDPVEYQLPGIIQVPVNVKQGMTFAAALRSILRQDPDIIMIGEMRDLETADIAVKAAITGHLVFSTLHTNDAISTVTRLVDMGIDPFMVSTAVLLVTNQRLIRKLCPHCKEEVKLPTERLLELGFTQEEAETGKVFRPTGCPKCFGGYKGRVALFEVFEVDNEIRLMIVKGSSLLEIKDFAIKERHMINLRRAGILQVLRGISSIDEVTRHT